MPAAPGLCTPGAAPTGTTTEFEEGIDINKLLLNGAAPSGVDGGIASIDPNKLEWDPAHTCAPVYPWNFVRTNTIFGVVHKAGGYTAWSDKHPSYLSVSGPGNGTNVDDYYSPEINSIPVGLSTVPGCEDDISLIWLSHSSRYHECPGTLESESPATSNIAGIGGIFSGPGIAQLFNPPGLPPNGDPRTPDIIVTPNIGVTYSGSGKKHAEHGGFSHDDTNVIMLLSNPSFSARTVTSPVETYQIAPTLLAALGLDPNEPGPRCRMRARRLLPGLELDIGKSLGD